MFQELWLVLVDPLTYIVVVSATALVYHGSYRSSQLVLSSSKTAEANGALLGGEYVQQLERRDMLIIPIFGSIALLIMFFFFQYIQMLLVIFQAAVTFSALSYAIYPWVSFLTHRIGLFQTRNGYISGAVSFSVVLGWILANHWIYVNLLGAGLCISALTFMQARNVRMLTGLFVLLLIYDVFWVFGSEYLFRDNVMVGVATKPADNPLTTVATMLKLPSTSWANKLDLPIKLMFPRGKRFSMLGLGDIVIPGLFATLMRRFQDLEVLRHSYFRASIVGYMVGLLSAIISSWVFRIAQPALIFLVPAILLFVFLEAFRKGELMALWRANEFEPKTTAIP